MACNYAYDGDRKLAKAVGPVSRALFISAPPQFTMSPRENKSSGRSWPHAAAASSFINIYIMLNGRVISSCDANIGVYAYILLDRDRLLSHCRAVEREGVVRDRTLSSFMALVSTRGALCNTPRERCADTYIYIYTYVCKKSAAGRAKRAGGARIGRRCDAVGLQT